MSETIRSAKTIWITRSLSVFYVLVLAGLPIVVIVVAATVGTHQAVVTGIAYACGVVLLGLPLYWFGAIVSWRGSKVIWRKRMASGFYKTLPKVEDDDG
jgi:hypothetical protein